MYYVKSSAGTGTRKTILSVVEEAVSLCVNEDDYLDHAANGYLNSSRADQEALAMHMLLVCKGD